MLAEPPFAENAQLNTDLSGDEVINCSLSPYIVLQSLPGHPLRFVAVDQTAFLQKELLVDRLDKLSSLFWLLATPEHSHISALHYQKVRGRELVISEAPDLHLVWYYDRVFIKPLPLYLTNYAFWKHFLSGDDPGTQALRKAAKGYLRSYCYLICHESDFNIAVEKKLIPRGWEFHKLLNFLEHFRSIADEEVPPRFRYGELRLSRLNFIVWLRGMGFFYHKVYGQYGPLLASTVAPFLFIFALLSIILAAMQVVLAVQQLADVPPPWNTFVEVSRWFSVVCLVFSALTGIFVPILIVILLLRELVYAIRHHL
ncbi:hypothetical protein BU17DRAFT_78323 [Hysterangium stoloniferum]|nr:hypothetical protein BU17DRAFT_78323 [Hysterangium stoloniferum]